MKKCLTIIVLFAFTLFTQKAKAQIDLGDIDLKDILGKVMHVDKGFAPKFALGNNPIASITKVGKILGLKKDSDINRLFRTFKTGRLVYKIASYAGGAVVVYSLVKKIDNASKTGDYETALYSGLGAIGSGLIVKFLTKGASYKAVDIFNGIAVKKIKDIFSIAPASNTAGIGIYVKL